MVKETNGKVAPKKAETKKAEAKKAEPKKASAEKAHDSEADGMSDEELAALAQSAAEREQGTRAQSGSKVLFISIAQDGSTALKKKDKNFIEGLSDREFYIQSKKIVLGDELKVVPLAIWEVYNEMTNDRKPRFLGIWLKDDAEKFPLVDGDFYKRALPNGNVLQPITWVIVYLPDHPELERCVLSFKSTGRKVATAWRKDIDARGGNPAQLEYIVTAEDTSNAFGEWYQVAFEFSREIFSIQDGKLAMKVKYARDAIMLQDAYTKEYESAQLIRKHSAATAIEDNRDADSDGDDGDDLDGGVRTF